MPWHPWQTIGITKGRRKQVQQAIHVENNIFLKSLIMARIIHKWKCKNVTILSKTIIHDDHQFRIWRLNKDLNSLWVPVKHWLYNLRYLKFCFTTVCFTTNKIKRQRKKHHHNTCGKGFKSTQSLAVIQNYVDNRHTDRCEQKKSMLVIFSS